MSAVIVIMFIEHYLPIFAFASVFYIMPSPISIVSFISIYLLHIYLGAFTYT